MPGSRPALSAVLALVAGLLLSVGVTACGGEKITADEVTAPPPELTIPESADPTPSATGTADADATPTPDGSTDDSSGSGSGDSVSGTATATPAPSWTGGTAAPQATATPTAAPQQDSSSSDTAPPAGSGAQKFEQFCEQNPGAC